MCVLWVMLDGLESGGKKELMVMMEEVGLVKEEGRGREAVERGKKEWTFWEEQERVGTHLLGRRLMFGVDCNVYSIHKKATHAERDRRAGPERVHVG